MSEPTPTPQATIDEFTYSIDDIREFTLASKKRALQETQLKVILKNKITRLKSNYNALISHLTIESEDRSKALFESIPKLTDVCNNISHEGVFEIIWLELNAMINSFAAALVTIHSKSDIWSVQGSATLLVQIISGLPKIDQLPSLLDQSTEDPEYLDRWIVTFNYLQFSAATYIGVIYAIKTVEMSDIILWSNQAFYYFSLLEKYFKIFEWENIAWVQRKEPMNFFIAISTITGTFQNFIDLLFILLKRLGSVWPSGISTEGLLEDQSFQSINSFISNLKSHVKTALDKAQQLYANNMWTVNDDPFQTAPIKNLLELEKMYDYYVAYIDALISVNPIIPDLNKNSAIIEKISYALELNEWFLTYTEQQAGDKKNILRSFLGSQYVDLIEHRLELLTLYTIYANNVSYFKEEMKKISWVFQDGDPLQYSDVFLKKLLVELFLSTKYQLDVNFDNLYDEISKFKELFHFKPRDLTALIILETLLGTFLNKKPIPSKDEILIDVNKKGLISGGDYHLFNEFQDYIDYLVPTLNGEPSILSENLLYRKTSINAFDSTTWLIPDFNQSFKQDVKIPIFYLPFNRLVDGIINKIGN